MKKGVNQWIFPEETDIRECIKMSKEAGFDAIELNYDIKGLLSLESKRGEIEDLSKYAQEIGIEICSLASGIFWEYTLTGEDKKKQDETKNHIRKMLEIGSWLGVDTILVVPGFTGRATAAQPVVDYDIAYDRALESFRELAGDAERFKVNIGIENVWNRFLLSPLEMRDFIDKIKSDYIGAYFDVGNVLNISYPEHWIKILSKRIKKVHIKDFSIAIGNVWGFVDLLEGDVNFRAVMQELKKIGYDDVLIAELFPHANYPERLLYKTSKDMDTILEAGDKKINTGE